ncbi:MAG: hypothetical protein J0H75_00755 [Rhizobiales bacterium]|nr:hypothetical protein [Hyphomicrobiales bacterium]
MAQVAPREVFFMLNELFRFQAAQKRFPEFFEECREIGDYFNVAKALHQSGKLTQKELSNVEGFLWQKYRTALPMELYVEMVNSGARDDLEAMIGHDGTMSDEAVFRSRRDAMNKVKLELMDNAWLEQRIDAKNYAELYLSEIDASDEGLREQIHSGKHDSAASEIYARRHDRPAQVMSPAMAQWAKDNGIKSLDHIFDEAQQQARHRADEFDDGYDEDGADKDGFVNLDVLQAREERETFREREEADARATASADANVEGA